MSAKVFRPLNAVWVLAIYGVINPASATAQSYIGVDLYTITAAFNWRVNDGAGSASGGQVTGGATNYTPPFLPFSALLWKPPAGELVLLAPMGFSAALASDDAQQVGAVGDHAVRWSGTVDSVVNLHPTHLAEFTSSLAFGIKGGQQVGIGRFNTGNDTITHALVWNGTANSAVDLHSNLIGRENSIARGTDGTHQVGVGHDFAFGNEHALLWSGTANSVVDLHPVGLSNFSVSVGYGVGGGQQVGIGLTSEGFSHALLWNGTAASAVSLHPIGFEESRAYGTNGIYQIGSGTILQDPSPPPVGTFVRHALLWSGTADSAIDLNSLLPFTAVASTANSIDEDGTIWGTATDSTGAIHAVRWSPVPEPATWLLFAAGAAFIVVFRSRLSRKFRCAERSMKRVPVAPY